jgi:hypothetical protein
MWFGVEWNLLPFKKMTNLQQYFEIILPWLFNEVLLEIFTCKQKLKIKILN